MGAHSMVGEAKPIAGVADASDRDLVSTTGSVVSTATMGRPLATAGGTLERVAAANRRRLRFHLSSLTLLVLVPAIAAVVVFCFVLQPQYEVEARFAVRGFTERLPGVEQFGASSPLGTILALTNNQESYLIADFIRSRECLDAVAARVDLEAAWGDAKGDVLTRIGRDASADARLRHWNRMVTVSIDTVSGTTGLTVRAYDGDDALAIGRAVLAAAEAFINGITDQMRRNAMDWMTRDVERAGAEIADARRAQRSLREERGFIDADASTKSALATLFDLRRNRALASIRFDAASRDLDESAPTAITARAELRAYDEQIARLEAQLTKGKSENEQTYSEMLRHYADVQTRNRLAEEHFAAAQNALARGTAETWERRIFIETYVPPAIPERSSWPSPLMGIVSVILIGLVASGTIGLLAEEIWEHAD